MSLALIQSYSSAEEEEENARTAAAEDYIFSDEEEEEEENGNSSGTRGTQSRYLSYRAVDAASDSASGLPSALDAFSKVSAPPQFLNNAVEGNVAVRSIDLQRPRHGRWRARKEKKELPSGAVMESKPQLVGLHERVRSDIQSSQSQASPAASTTDGGGGKRVAGVANPSAEDAAQLLMMCVPCGIPKTSSNGRMTCPVCGDRPPANDPSQDAKRKGSAVKDKEKSKRMKGQSSHATWKSETEMSLRQQFD